ARRDHDLRVRQRVSARTRDLVPPGAGRTARDPTDGRCRGDPATATEARQEGGGRCPSPAQGRMRDEPVSVGAIKPEEIWKSPGASKIAVRQVRLGSAR